MNARDRSRRSLAGLLGVGVAVATAGSVLVGCGVGAGSGSLAGQGTNPATSASAPPPSSASSLGSTSTSDPNAAAARCVRELVETLSPQERIGQLLMVALDSGSDVGGVDAQVTDQHVGGVILLGRWSGTTSVTAATHHLNSLAGGVGLFLAADQEGGQVQPLRGPGFSAIPSATDQGALSPSALRTSATTWADELAESGINVNLAPVADTVPADLGTANEPIGKHHREYGATPAAVIPGVEAFIEGMHAGGVAATVKHFPGLGRVRDNTDYSAAEITDVVTTATDPYLEPFRAGIAAGADFVMVGSANYPNIDAKNQALFSSAVIDGVLRGHLGYRGVVITDDVGAAASVSAVPVGERATRFLAAGGDIVLTASPATIAPMASAIEERAATDETFARQVEGAVNRVLTLKRARGLATCAP